MDRIEIILSISSLLVFLVGIYVIYRSHTHNKKLKDVILRQKDEDSSLQTITHLENDIVFNRLMTDLQKQRLTNSLLENKSSYHISHYLQTVFEKQGVYGNNYLNRLSEFISKTRFSKEINLELLQFEDKSSNWFYNSLTDVYKKIAEESESMNLENTIYVVSQSNERYYVIINMKHGEINEIIVEIDSTIHWKNA